MEDVDGGALNARVHHLLEEAARPSLVEMRALGDEVEEILARRRTLHYDEIAARLFEPVEQLDDARDVLHAIEQRDLQRNALAAELHTYSASFSLAQSLQLLKYARARNSIASCELCSR